MTIFRSPIDYKVDLERYFIILLKGEEEPCGICRNELDSTSPGI
jgi:hypothetical protein